MAYEYLRQARLIVANATGNGFDFGSFRCKFTVKRGDFQTPNSLDATIYNLSTVTANTISKNEFTTVSLSAGYPGSVGLLFQGNIKQFRQGRVNQLDSYVTITAADGDEAYNYATISTTIPAGTRPGSVGAAIVSRLAAVGNQPITQGYQPNFPATKSIRGRVMYGMARDEMRDFAAQNDCKWSIQDGAVTLIPFVSFIPGGQVPVISVKTGLIGVPEQTQAGINVRVLLNSAIRVGQLIRLDSQINQFRFALDLQSQASNAKLALQNKTNADGLYYVMVANHTGDTRGTDWYSDLVCLAVDATLVDVNQTNALLTTAPSEVAIKRYGGT
jgi:hypothetical protein